MFFEFRSKYLSYGSEAKNGAILKKDVSTGLGIMLTVIISDIALFPPIASP